MMQVVQAPVGQLGERLRPFALSLLAVLAIAFAAGQLGDGVTGIVTALVVAGVVALMALLPLMVGRGGTPGDGLRGLGTGWTLPRVSEPDAAGHPRPRAPGRQIRALI